MAEWHSTKRTDKDAVRVVGLVLEKVGEGGGVVID
jgi:hypothetical protein